MNDMNSTHPYTLDIDYAPGSGILFQWAIRKGGKLVERSDRRYPSRAEATRRGEDAMERHLAGR